MSRVVLCICVNSLSVTYSFVSVCVKCLSVMCGFVSMCKEPVCDVWFCVCV